MVGRLCPSCGLFLDEGTRHRCKKGARSRRRKIYDDHRWQATREYVFERDEYRCRVCGRRADELELGERLACDHWPVSVLEVRDPYDPGGCRTVCTTCSGREDAPRAHAG